ncbi:MAG: hypothetical protein LBD43_00005 [Holosporales bacterium]|nr:hypothetical protein [Holosporales bacterium]
MQQNPATANEPPRAAAIPTVANTQDASTQTRKYLATIGITVERIAKETRQSLEAVRRWLERLTQTFDGIVMIQYANGQISAMKQEEFDRLKETAKVTMKKRESDVQTDFTPEIKMRIMTATMAAG